MDITIIINKMIQLFLVLALGYLLQKIGQMDKSFNKKLTSLLLNVTTPAMILHAVLSTEEGAYEYQVGMAFVVGIAYFIVIPLIGWLIAQVLRVHKPQQGAYIFMTTFGNVGFMGFPVINAIFGSGAMLYAAIFNMLFNLFAFTIGARMMLYGTGQKTEMNLKHLLTPGMLSSLLALLLFFLKLPFPAIIVDTFDMVGSLTTPTAMLVIGSTLATIPLKEVFGEFRIYPYALLKQIILPVLLFPLLRLLIADELLRGVLLILIAMPVANLAVLFSTEYGGDEKLTAKAIFLTTLLSVCTIPLLVYWLLV